MLQTANTFLLTLIVVVATWQWAEPMSLVPAVLGGSSDDVTALVDGFDKRRGGELFGKRAVSGEVALGRSSRRSHELFGKRSLSVSPAEYVVVSGFPDIFPGAHLSLERTPIHWHRRQQANKAAGGSGEEDEEGENVVLKRRNRELFGKRSAPLSSNAPIMTDDEWSVSEPELGALFDALVVKQRARRARGGELFG